MIQLFFYVIEQVEVVGDNETTSGALAEDESYPTLEEWPYLAKKHCPWQSREREDARNRVKNVEVQIAKAAKTDPKKREPESQPRPYIDEKGQQFSGTAISKREVKPSSGEKRDRKLDNADSVVTGSDSRKKKRASASGFWVKMCRQRCASW